MTVSIYPRGAGIPYHVDSLSQFGRAVYAVSLASSVDMDFRNLKTKEMRSAFLKPRSAVVMLDQVRTDWEHGIKERRTDTDEHGNVWDRAPERVSLTLRYVQPPLWFEERMVMDNTDNNI